MKTILKWTLSIIAIIIAAAVFGAINAQAGSGVIMMTPFILAGFTEDQSKSFSDFMSNQAESIQTKVKSLIEAAKNDTLMYELKLLIKGDGAETKGISSLIPIMQKQMDDLAIEAKNAKLNYNKAIKDETVTLEEGLKMLFDTKEFKDAKAAGFKTKSVFEIKANTGDITGDVNRSIPNMTVSFAPERAQSFIPNCLQLFIGQDKNRVIWMDGSYTSNVGYVAEGVGIANADVGTAVEKGREMAKISAKLPLTTEMLEDAEYVASAFKVKMQEKALLFTDNEVYAGDGSDGVNPKHIYGIKGHATTFSAVTIGKNAKVAFANIGDLINGMILQAKLSQFNNSNIIWINPSDFFDFKTAKDAQGNYMFVKDVNGTYSINGLQVVTNTAVTVNTMTIADKGKLELYWKRRPEVKFSQMNGTDFTDDNWTAVLFLRAQLVVETANKPSIIHVPDITAAIAALKAI